MTKKNIYKNALQHLLADYLGTLCFMSNNNICGKHYSKKGFINEVIESKIQILMPINDETFSEDLDKRIITEKLCKKILKIKNH